MALEPEDAEELEELLARHEHLAHLRIKKRGDSLTIYSGDISPPHLHARFTHLGRDQWGLSLPRHTGRWERTPFMGNIKELVDTLVEDLGLYLDDFEAHARKNPSRTFDPSN